MDTNDAQLIKRMATDLGTIASGVKTLNEAVPALATRLAALEAAHGTTADTTEIADILSSIEAAAPAVAAAAESASQTVSVAEAAMAPATIEAPAAA